MKTLVCNTTFEGKPAKAVITVLGKYPDVFTDTITYVLLVYTNNYLFREEVLAGMGPKMHMKPTRKSLETISSNIVCEAWDKMLNQ